MPYSKEPAAINREYLAEVVRMDPRSNGLTGVGIKILMEMGIQQHSYSFNAPPRK
jgi:hypothetical protein